MICLDYEGERSEYNEETIKWASNLKCTKWTQHMDARHHYLRETAERGKIELVHVQSQEQVVNAPTEHLASKTLSKHRNALLNPV